MNYERQFKIDILTLLSDNNEHPRTEIIEHVTNNYLKKVSNKNKQYPIDKIKWTIESIITNLFDYHYIKKSKNNIDYWMITLKGSNFIKKNPLTARIINNKNMDNNSPKKDIDIKLDKLNQKIESNSYEIYEMINVIFEELNKKEEENSNRISALEKLIKDYKIEEVEIEKELEEFENNNIYTELVKYLKISNYDTYLTIEDLSNIMTPLQPDELGSYTHNNLMKVMLKFYQNNLLNPDDYIVEGRNTTYFMAVSISDSSIITKTAIKIITDWIKSNIMFTDDKKDKILFNDLVYEIVKSFKLDNVNRIYYDNIDSMLKSVLLSFYDNHIRNNSMLKDNDLIICYGVKYKSEINMGKYMPKTGYSIKNLTYDWLTENLIRTDSSSNWLTLDEIYDNIYPYLSDKNISFNKVNVIDEIGSCINLIFQGEYKIKQEIIDNQTVYIGLKLKNQNTKDKLKNQNTKDKLNDNKESNQSQNKRPSELMEEWLNERIKIDRYSNHKLYLDDIIFTFLNDLNNENIKIKDSPGLRSNMSRVLRKFYKQKTNKKIVTAQDEKLKRYYKNIQIKNI